MLSRPAHKYHAIPTEVDGVKFASRMEARRYRELLLLQRGGMIRQLTLHPRFPLVVNGIKVGTYVGDFEYLDVLSGLRTVEDAKGVVTPVYRLKRKLVQALYGIEIKEVQA